MSRRYWIGVASRDHVARGLAGGFAQLCHGKASPLRRMRPGDGLIYYSPREKFAEAAPCQRFTAIGLVLPGEAYQANMGNDFHPWRRDICFIPAQEADIRPLLTSLACIPDPRRWGQAFRFGFLSVSSADFQLIAHAMQANPLNENFAAALENQGGDIVSGA
ncbi:EVE domain-containing protein [uncultured Aquitalea sp.]|uniref:EVE domain-containing protein n=1 Tax=uncultured Aquitalea sp. TaxID=540272 RepID=UPI0025FA781B|nr:EVE domain-containing protein [uncultured Aquitalea sp.]